eukprot:jgi/Undpi1/3256/HiC_scaffold_15.g06630.m1
MTLGAITSLYFDCPANNLPLYHDRVALKEGANLLRVRWYGRPQLDHAILQGAPRDNVPPPHLKDSECAFVELKTHHEAWTGDKSVKRRFKLRNSELSGSAKIELDEAEVAELPSLRGPPTRPPGAAGGANAPPPQLDEKTAKTRKALIEKLALAQEVQRLVLEKRIRPLLITELSSNNEVRVTLDAPLVGFAIPPPGGDARQRRGANAPLADKTFWDSFLGRGLSQPMPGQEYHKPFPFAVLELKLQGDPPPWVAGLVKIWNDCGYIRCIEKYSKYQHIVNHAIARNPASLASVPEEKKPRKSSKKHMKLEEQPNSRTKIAQDSGYHVKLRKVPVWFTALETHGPFPGPPPARNADAYLGEDHGNVGAGGISSPRSVYGGSNISFPKMAHNAKSPARAGAAGSASGGHRRMPSDVSVKSGLGLNRTGTSQMRSGQGTGGGGKTPKGGKFLARQLSLRSFQQTVKNHANTINKASNVKVEPKTFFANERTFIQWISAAVFVYGVSTALFAFDANSEENGITIASAAILSAVSLMILIYGAVIFYLRLDRLKNRKDSKVFADKWGPGMLAVGLFAAIVTVLAMQIHEYIEANDKPKISTAGVSEAVTHVNSFVYDGVLFTPSTSSRNAALVQMAYELNNFEPDKAYTFEDKSDGRPNKRLRKRTEHIISASPASDITELPYGEAVLVTVQEELVMYPGASVGNFDLSMEFFNTASVDFLGPYATESFTNRENTAIQLGVRCFTDNADAFSGNPNWLASLTGVNGTAPSVGDESSLGVYFENVGTALSTHLDTDSYDFTESGTVYVWSAEFDLAVGGLDVTLVWEVEYPSQEDAAGNGDSDFDTSLPSMLSLEVPVTSGSNFTTWGLKSADAFFGRIAEGGLTDVSGVDCL